MNSDKISASVLRKFVLYDAESGVLTWVERTQDLFSHCKNPAHQCRAWNAKYAGTVADTSDGQGYIRLDILGRKMRAHRIAWAMFYGVWPENFIDHINGVRGDNRIANLRDIQKAENHKNAKRPANNTSGHVGVGWNKTLQKWVASITVNQKKRHLGVFDNIADAVAARATANSEHSFHINHGRG